MVIVYSNYVKVIPANLIGSIKFEAADCNRIKSDAKISQVASNFFTTKFEDYELKTPAPSLLKKVALLPYGITKSLLSLPYHLFTTLLSRSPDLTWREWLKKSALVLGKDFQEAAGYVMLPFLEKKALYLIDDATFQRNCLLNMYDPKNKENFLASFLKDLVFNDLDSEANGKIQEQTRLKDFIDLFQHNRPDFIKLLKKNEDRVTIEDRKIIEFITKNLSEIPESIIESCMFYTSTYQPWDHALRIAYADRNLEQPDISWIKEYFEEISFSHLTSFVMINRVNSLIEKMKESPNKKAYLKELKKVVKNSFNEYKKSKEKAESKTERDIFFKTILQYLSPVKRPYNPLTPEERAKRVIMDNHLRGALGQNF